MANSKVQLADGTVLMDLTGDSVTAAHLEVGYTAHGADGEPILGTLNPGGGGGSYVVTLTNTGGTITADKTVAGVKAAIDAGMQIVLTGDIEGGGTAIPTAQTFLLLGYPAIILSYKSYIGDPFEAFYMAMSIDGADVWEATRTVIPALHDELLNRDVADCHPMSSITGLESALGGKQAAFSTGDGLSMVNDVLSLDLDNYDGGVF